MFQEPNRIIQELQKKAQYLDKVRAFFKERQVLEVVTPLLRASTNPDPAIQSMRVDYSLPGIPKTTGYLQTSPEFAMKELLASGSGSIYQIAKAFRDGEEGRWHRVEFMMLEWYRPSWSYHQLMDEVSEFASLCFGFPAAVKISYQDIFLSTLGINPHTATSEELISHLKKGAYNRLPEPKLMSKDDWLHFILTHEIEPSMDPEKPLLLYDYPETQAALAAIKKSTPRVAERFELYFKGVELANGFQELTSSAEQRQRFLRDIRQRFDRGEEELPMDEDFLTAVDQLPVCSGVAVGLDRIMALSEGKNKLMSI